MGEYLCGLGLLPLSSFFRICVDDCSIRFVKGPQPGRNTGFDIDEADLLEMKQCRGIVVASAVFGSVLHDPFLFCSQSIHSHFCVFLILESLYHFSDAFDDVKAPQNISKYAEETVCFYMFVDEETESILKRERGLDGNKKVGIWRVVVVHNLPYSDGRRNGKVNTPIFQIRKFMEDIMHEVSPN